MFTSTSHLSKSLEIVALFETLDFYLVNCVSQTGDIIIRKEVS